MSDVSNVQKHYMYPNGFDNGGLGSESKTPMYVTEPNFFGDDRNSPVQKPPTVRPPPSVRPPVVSPVPTNNANWSYTTQEPSSTWSSVFGRGAKYVIEGLAVGFFAYLIAGDSLTPKQVLLIALVAMIVYGILDSVWPTVTYSASSNGYTDKPSLNNS